MVAQFVMAQAQFTRHRERGGGVASLAVGPVRCRAVGYAGHGRGGAGKAALLQARPVPVAQALASVNERILLLEPIGVAGAPVGLVGAVVDGHGVSLRVVNVIRAFPIAGGLLHGAYARLHHLRTRHHGQFAPVGADLQQAVLPQGTARDGGG